MFPFAVPTEDVSMATRLLACPVYGLPLSNPRAGAARDARLTSMRSRGGRFNPRARAARDLRADGQPEQDEVSIHPRARRATTHCGVEMTEQGEFQSTRARGARHIPELQEQVG